ncbi:MAG: hypothetical protein ACI4E1_04745 [Lachnospira sp.]
MKRLKIIKAELIHGFSQCSFKLIIIAVMTALININYIDKIIKYYYRKTLSKNVSYLECLLYFFKGDKPYIISEKEIIELPYTFLFINLFLAYLIGDYISRDIERFGMQILLRCVSKINWWIARCVWAFCAVIAYYAAMFAGIFIVWITAAGFKGDLFSIRSDELSRFIGVSIEQLSLDKVLLFLIVMILTSVATSFIQLVITFCSSSIYGFMYVVSVNIMSCYYTTGWFTGNYQMIRRSEYISTHFGLIINLLLIMASFIAGVIMIKRKDYL